MFLDPHFLRQKVRLTALACRWVWQRRAADAFALLHNDGFRLVRLGDLGGTGDSIRWADAVYRSS